MITIILQTPWMLCGVQWKNIDVCIKNYKPAYLTKFIVKETNEVDKMYPNCMRQTPNVWDLVALL